MKHDGFDCPVCGADVPPNAAACPDCGADENTGWSENTIYDGTDIEDPAEFDHAEWERRERGADRPRWGRLIVIALLLVALAAWLLRW